MVAHAASWAPVVETQTLSAILRDPSSRTVVPVQQTMAADILLVCKIAYSSSCSQLNENHPCSWPAGSNIVVEEFLDGEEASFFALLGGKTCLALASAQVGLR